MFLSSKLAEILLGPRADLNAHRVPAAPVHPPGDDDLGVVGRVLLLAAVLGPVRARARQRVTSREGVKVSRVQAGIGRLHCVVAVLVAVDGDEGDGPPVPDVGHRGRLLALGASHGFRDRGSRFAPTRHTGGRPVQLAEVDLALAHAEVELTSKAAALAALAVRTGISRILDGVIILAIMTKLLFAK